MKILAFELSADVRSVAAWDTDGGPPTLATETHTRHTRLFALIEQALQSARWQRDDVEGIAVGLGPGSYTGIRMAIAAAQGWRAARPIKLWGISSFHVMAEGLWRAGRRGEIFLAVDAQRKEACWAAYQITDDGWRETAPSVLLSHTEVCRRAVAGQKILGPDVARWCPLGETWHPSAVDLARLAGQSSPLGGGEELTPIYLREARFAKAPPPRMIPDL